MTDRRKPEDLKDTELDEAAGGTGFDALKPRLSPDKVRALRPTGIRIEQPVTGVRVNRLRVK